jgi:hypothetical protein
LSPTVSAVTRGRSSALSRRVHNRNPVWSTDSQWITSCAVLGRSTRWTPRTWRIRHPAEGRSGDQRERHGEFLATLDTRTLLYVDARRTVPALALAVIHQRNARAGARRGRDVQQAADGPRALAHVLEAPVVRSRRRCVEVEPYAVPADRANAPRFGGSSVFYLASSGGNDGLWRLRDGQALPIRSGADGEILDAPAATRDGASVAFVALRAGERRLTVMSSDGTSPRTIASSIRTQEASTGRPTSVDRRHQ